MKNAGPCAWAWLIVGLTCGCGSNHHVSPWPDRAVAASLLQPTDVASHLARIEEEMKTEQLELEVTVRGEFADGEPFELRGYGGYDELGHRRDAVRVATRFGVVMAVGPVEIAERLRGIPTRLVEALAEDGTWRSGTDFNGDGLHDVVVAADDGTFEVWGMHARGAAPYPMQCDRAPDRAIDINGDGRPELAFGLRLGAQDPLDVELLEVLAFSAGTYRADAPTVVAFHDRMRRAVADGAADEERGGDAERLAAVVQVAWHGLRSGISRERVLSQADRSVEALGGLSPELQQAWTRWRAWLVAVPLAARDGGSGAWFLDPNAPAGARITTSCDAPAVRVQTGPATYPRPPGPRHQEPRCRFTVRSVSATVPLAIPNHSMPRPTKNL